MYIQEVFMAESFDALLRLVEQGQVECSECDEIASYAEFGLPVCADHRLN